MRSLWIIVTTVALANFLAVVALLAWLAGTGRLSNERLHAVREVFKTTVAEEEAAKKLAEAERAQAEAAAAQEAFMREPPTPAEGEVADQTAVGTAAQQDISRLSREADDLRRTFAREIAHIERAREQLRKEREEFDALRARIAALEGSEQFEKAVRLYESLKPKQAKDLLQELIDDGEVEQAVSYLNAMQIRTASKIIAEFDDAALAATLLERVRTRGLEVVGAPPQSSQ
jgi:flagellar motility protein MotE (MotC chaperone)